MTTSSLEESASLKSFQSFSVHVDFFVLWSTEVAAYSKPANRDMIVKRLIQGRNNMTAGIGLNQIFAVLGSISCHFKQK